MLTLIIPGRFNKLKWPVCSIALDDESREPVTHNLQPEHVQAQSLSRVEVSQGPGLGARRLS
jgi:hypothetical protein